MTRYRLRPTGYSSARFGNCEVCRQHVSDVYVQTEERHFKSTYAGETYEGWAHRGAVYGHRECLVSRQKKGAQQA